MLVGEHGLTRPPADRPSDGILRQSELRLLDRAPQRVRRERRWAQLQHWCLRLVPWGCGGCLRDGVDAGCGGRVERARSTGR